MYSKYNSDRCGRGCCRRCHPPCGDVCCSSRVTKGLVQNLREKIICLQNDGLQLRFPYGPIKKRRKYYYCFMLRKMNMLDKKLQNLEDLLLSHLDRKSKGRIDTEDNYLAFYHSVHSLIELVNKLKDDIIYKQNDKHYSDQNMSQLCDRIQALESELQDLSIYLERIQNVDENICDPNKHTAQVYRFSQSDSSVHGKVFLTEHKELTPNYIKFNVKSKVKKTKSNDKQLIENKGKYKNQTRYKTFHSNHSQSKWQSYACNKVAISQNESSFGIIQSSSKQSKVFDNCLTRLSSNISICSTDIDKDHKTLDNKQYKENLNLCVRNNFQPRNRRSFLQRENRFPVSVEVQEMCFDKPTLQRKSFKKKQKKVMRPMPVRDSAGYHYTESSHTSHVHAKLKSPIKVQSDHITDQKPIKNSKRPHHNTFETNKNEQISKNKPSIYYSVVPGKYNQYSQRVKHRNQHKHNENYFNRNAIVQEKNNFLSQKERRLKENYSYYKFQMLDCDSLEDFSTDEDVHENLKTEKWCPHNTDDLSSSESEKMTYTQRKTNYLPFKLNKTAPRVSLSALEKSQNKKNPSGGKHKTIKLYENQEYQEYFKRPHIKVEKEATKPDHDVKNYWQDSHRETQKKNVYGSNLGKKEKRKNSNGKFTEVVLNHSPVYKSDSYETIDENEYFSKSKINIDDPPRNNNTDRVSEELVIFLDSTTSSARSEDTDLRQIINALKEFETDVCNKCIVTERRIKLLPHKSTKSKCKGNTKIIIKREIVKCSNCKMKLEKAILEFNNKKPKPNENQSSVEESPEITPGEENKKLDSKLPENNNKTDTNFKHKPDEIIQIINNKKKDIWEGTNINNIVPTFQAKLKEGNIFHTSHLNEISQNKRLDIPNFGNTININIDRGSHSVEPPPDKSSKSVNIEEIFAKGKAFQRILSDAQLHSKNQMNLPEITTETNSNSLYSDMNIINNSRHYIANNISGDTKKESKLSNVIKLNTLLVAEANRSEVNHETTSKSQERILKTIEFLHPKDNSSVLFTDLKSEHEVQNLQLSLSEKDTELEYVTNNNKSSQDTKLEDVTNNDKSTELINFSKTPTALHLIHQKDDEEITRSIKNPLSDLSKRNQFSHSESVIPSNVQNVLKPNTVNKSGREPLFIQKEDIFSEPNILKNQHHKKITTTSHQDCHDSNVVAYKPTSYKKYAKLHKMSKKLTEDLIEREMLNNRNVNSGTSKVLDGSVSVIYQCNIFEKDNFVGRKSGTFRIGRGGSKRLKNKHKHTVYPKASSKELNSFNCNRKLVENNKKHVLNTNPLKVFSGADTEKTYHKMLNLTMTSDSSFSILNWEKVAKKLKQDKDFSL